ncbi:YdeI/OmpD-associated family protein [Curtobacterium sp. RRHDQ10]|uniref:YdeI/OmpD-associated family protein n=1 Tax=Curtobacterium phyllosphaerae TaxID=3413379 RepID=UPI003BF0D888
MPAELLVRATSAPIRAHGTVRLRRAARVRRAALGLEARMRFTTTVLQARKTATGLPVPESVLDELGAGRRPAVVVTLDGGYTYRSTVGAMNGQSLVPLSAEHRSASGIAAGDTVEVTLELDTLPRELPVPDDLAAAFTAAGVRAAFDTLSHSRKRALVDPVEQAKAPETRQRRIDKAVETLRAATA